MAGGSIGLASGSASGLDLTNVKPQITYFRKVYKRHTNFGIDHFQQNTNATIAFHTRSIFWKKKPLKHTHVFLYKNTRLWFKIKPFIKALYSLSSHLQTHFELL